MDHVTIQYLVEGLVISFIVTRLLNAVLAKWMKNLMLAFVTPIAAALLMFVAVNSIAAINSSPRLSYWLVGPALWLVVDFIRAVRH